jgi:predicted MFS family arabinose efflux permease
MSRTEIAIDSRRGRTALLLASCAGMADLIALPVSVSTLISRFGFDAQQAGALATLLLAGVVVASLVLAPHFPRLACRPFAMVGFGLSAVGSFWAALQSDFYALAALQAACGLATGAALTVTNGTIARSVSPHQMYAGVSSALGVFGVLLFAATPPIVQAIGGSALFVVIGAVKAGAALTAFVWFPSQPTVAYVQVARTPAASRVPKIVWFGMAGLAAMTIVHAMTASYLVQVGAHRGFQVTSVNAVLIGMALVALLPGPVAAALETRWPAQRVLLGGAVLQLALSTVVMTVTAFTPYASAAVLFPSVIVFTHTFAFGLLATLDSSGRSLAATPATTMAGAALGALVGGALVKFFGFGGIPLAAAVLAAFAVLCFSRLPSAGALHSRKEIFE